MIVSPKITQSTFLSLLLISTSYVPLAQASFPEKDSETEESSFISHHRKLRDLPGTIYLGNLTSTQGFLIENIGNYTNYASGSGSSVSSAGDVNNDGIADVIIGAPIISPPNSSEAGEAYVIYGKKEGYANPINVEFLNVTQGFLIEGAHPGDNIGYSVSGAGDINNDGIDDVTIGAPFASPQNRTGAGEAYVIYGKNGGYVNPIDLRFLNATQGFLIEGAEEADLTGNSVSGAGDVNDDGIADVIIGALQTRVEAGKAYVIYGKSGGYTSSLDLRTLNATQGFLIEGAEEGDFTGSSVNSAGDVNDDGIDDVIIGAAGISSPNRSEAGGAYVIYGKQGGYTVPIDLRFLQAIQGLFIEGAQAYTGTGSFVSGAGDVNDDNIADVIIGSVGSDTAYVIYGNNMNDSLSVMHSLSQEAEHSRADTKRPFYFDTSEKSRNAVSYLQRRLQEASTNAVSSLEVPGASSLRWIAQKWTTLSSWWNAEQQDKPLLSPAAQGLAELKKTSIKLQEEAPEGAHSYYQHSLQELIADMEEKLKQPKTVDEEVFGEFKQALAQIQKEFKVNNLYSASNPNPAGNLIKGLSFTPLTVPTINWALPLASTIFIDQ